MSSLSDLTKKRGLIKGKVTSLRKYFSSTPLVDRMQLSLRLSKFEPCYNEFTLLQDEIELIDNNLDQIVERENFEQSYFALVADIKVFLDENTSIMSTTESSPHKDCSMMKRPNLPLLEIHKFDGTYSTWTAFKDSFESLVGSYNSVSNVEKLQHLRASLTGSALQTIQSLPITNENYHIAWQHLKDRFENKRLIINSHLNAIFNLPSAKANSNVQTRQVYDGLLVNIEALRNLGEPVESWNSIIVYIISTKFDCILQREWESQCDATKVPTFDQLKHFLKKKSELLETLAFNRPDREVQQCKYPRRRDIPQSIQSYTVTQDTNCPVCNAVHPLYRCDKFRTLSVEDRTNKVRLNRLCFNCLAPNHISSKCIKRKCTLCNGNHHSMLHKSKVKTVTTVSQDVNNEPVILTGQHTTSSDAVVKQFTPTIVNCAQISLGAQVLLSTAQVLAVNGKLACQARVLLDSGSQSNFITENMCKLLRLQLSQKKVTINGINQQVSNSYSTATLTICDLNHVFTAQVTVLVVPTITNNLPTLSISKLKFNIPAHISLADPNFNLAGPIDILIGGELFWNLIKQDQIQLGTNKPILQNTVFGYVVSRVYAPNPKLYPIHDHSTSLHCTANLCDQVTRFWEIDGMPITDEKTEEKSNCETHFVKNYKRNLEGRFVVRLPFKIDPKLGNTKYAAQQRLLQVEKRLTTQQLHQYRRFMTEYITLGHMSKVNTSSSFNNCVYLPHHAVFKDHSDTSKIRVVFDASLKSTNGRSLNELLSVGPTIQDDLFTILLRFRKWPIVVLADIEKMYRQVLIDPEDRRFQCVLWREHPNGPIDTYQSNTVTYGMASAPFLAIRSLRQLAIDADKDHEFAAYTILNDFYVDDCMTGVNTVKEALQLYNQLNQLLQQGGFHLRKWTSNSNEVKSTITNGNTNDKHHVASDDTIRTLGLMWCSTSDTFQFNTLPTELKSQWTKRQILSTISKLFDPLGLVGPVVTAAKILLQSMWQRKMGWDEPVPNDIATDWNQYIKKLVSIQVLKIPRCTFQKSKESIHQLIGFCDASSVAYGACVYLRSDDQGTMTCHLLCSKSRVAPIKKLTIPRLELCAAVLLAKLMEKVRNAIKLNIDNEYLFSDSSVTLSWIVSQKPQVVFVSNRINVILNLTNVRSWRHVSGKINPADLISRGCTPDTLKDNNLWWFGPSFLLNPKEIWPNSSWKNDELEVEVINTSCQVLTSVSEPWELFERYSSTTKLIRITAMLLRFIKNAKNKDNQTVGFLSYNELQGAEMVLIRIVQQDCFQKDIDIILKSPTTYKGNLKHLSPFIDDQGLLRVGGRLQNAIVNHCTKHPYLLPAKHNFTTLLIETEHKRLLHVGPNTLLSLLRLRYWPINGRNATRNVVRRCVTCSRVNPMKSNYVMGNLPATRVNPSRAFTHCGIDFCGPFHLKERLKRGNNTEKCYVAVFVCLSVRAVHLELVSKLNTDAFLGAFHRFTARRGRPKNVYTDNGTNFVGTNNRFKEMERIISRRSSQDKIQAATNVQGIQWHFSPAGSPHFNGLQEAAVKATKYHLRRVMGSTILTFEEMNTLLAMIESILNSRPLAPLSTDPNDCQVLTPSHFLIGDSLLGLPDTSITQENIHVNHLDRWQHIQQMMSHFWKSWSKTYLTNLQVRTKWNSGQSTEFEIGNLVLVHDENHPPLQWLMGRIVQLHPGHDHVVRVASIKTRAGIIKRTTKKISKLPI